MVDGRGLSDRSAGRSKSIGDSQEANGRIKQSNFDKVAPLVIDPPIDLLTHEGGFIDHQLSSKNQKNQMAEIVI